MAPRWSPLEVFALLLATAKHGRKFALVKGDAEFFEFFLLRSRRAIGGKWCSLEHAQARHEAQQYALVISGLIDVADVVPLCPQLQIIQLQPDVVLPDYVPAIGQNVAGGQGWRIQDINAANEAVRLLHFIQQAQNLVVNVNFANDNQGQGLADEVDDLNINVNFGVDNQGLAHEVDDLEPVVQDVMEPVEVLEPFPEVPEEHPEVPLKSSGRDDLAFDTFPGSSSGRDDLCG